MSNRREVDFGPGEFRRLDPGRRWCEAERERERRLFILLGPNLHREPVHPAPPPPPPTPTHLSKMLFPLPSSHSSPPTCTVLPCFQASAARGCTCTTCLRPSLPTSTSKCERGCVKGLCEGVVWKCGSGVASWLSYSTLAFSLTSPPLLPLPTPPTFPAPSRSPGRWLQRALRDRPLHLELGDVADGAPDPPRAAVQPRLCERPGEAGRALCGSDGQDERGGSGEIGMRSGV